MRKKSNTKNKLFIKHSDKTLREFCYLVIEKLFLWLLILKFFK